MKARRAAHDQCRPHVVLLERSLERSAPDATPLSADRRVPWVWKDSIVFRPQAWPLARSASVQVIERPVGRQHQPGDRVAQLDAVAAGLVDVQEERLLDGVLVRAGLDEHAVCRGRGRRRAGCPRGCRWRTRCGAGARACRSSPRCRRGRRTCCVKVSHWAAIVPRVEQDLLGGPRAEHVADEVAVGGDVGGEVVDVVQAPDADAAAGLGLRLVLQRRPELRRAPGTTRSPSTARARARPGRWRR